MNMRKQKRDVAQTLDTAEELINDVIINVRSDEESKSYNRKLKRLYRVKALMLAAPELYEALRAAQSALQGQDDGGGGADTFTGGVRAAMYHALRKAEGVRA